MSACVISRLDYCNSVLAGLPKASIVNKLDYSVDASAVIACIDNVLALNNNCWHVIGGDFNFDCAPFNNNFGYSIFADVTSDYNLIVVTNMFLMVTIRT